MDSLTNGTSLMMMQQVYLDLIADGENLTEVSSLNVGESCEAQ